MHVNHHTLAMCIVSISLKSILLMYHTYVYVHTYVYICYYINVHMYAQVSKGMTEKFIKWKKHRLMQSSTRVRMYYSVYVILKIHTWPCT